MCVVRKGLEAACVRAIRYCVCSLARSWRASDLVSGAVRGHAQALEDRACCSATASNLNVERLRNWLSSGSALFFVPTLPLARRS